VRLWDNHQAGPKKLSILNHGLELAAQSLVRCLTVLFLLTGLSGPLGFAAAPVQYVADGVPTGLEEEIRWRVNRGRFDTASENQTRGTAYLPQRSTNLLVWSNLATGYLAGTGSNMTWLDPAKGIGNRQFYRLLIHQP